MHASTEDLLSVRDGEPLDAARASACERPEHTPEIERLRSVKQALRELPDIEPPPGVWQRAVAAAHSERSRRSIWPRALAGLGVAAAVAAVAIFVVAGSERVPDGEWVATTVPPATWRPPAVVAPPTPMYVSLVRESERLERVLSQISYQRPLMKGSTAGTIVGLEDRILLIDEQLSYGSARGLPPPQRDALWGERVDLLNALVYVRLAQSQRPGF